MPAKPVGSGGTLGAALVGGYLEHFSLKRDKRPPRRETETSTRGYRRRAPLDLLVFRWETKLNISFTLNHETPFHCVPTRVLACCFFQFAPRR